VGKIVYEELDEALKDDCDLIKVDKPDSNTLLFKPRVINLDLYAPEVQNGPVISRTYIRQAGRATLFLEVHDAVSGEILARWVDTREDLDRGYFEWANRITNTERVRYVVSAWAGRLVEGLNKLKAVN
jgi:MoxR-like ATPase